MTDAIWPETLTLIEYMSRKFWFVLGQAHLVDNTAAHRKAEMPAAPIIGFSFLPSGRNKFNSLAKKRRRRCQK